MPAMTYRKTINPWERLQPRIKPAFFAAEAAPTMLEITASAGKCKAFAGMARSYGLFSVIGLLRLFPLFLRPALPRIMGGKRGNTAPGQRTLDRDR